jgi:hypothetical protein
MWWAPRFIGLTKHSLSWRVRRQNTSGLVVRAGWWGRCLGRGAGNTRALDRTARRKAGWQEEALAAFDFADLGARRRRALQAGGVDGPWKRPGWEFRDLYARARSGGDGRTGQRPP